MPERPSDHLFPSHSPLNSLEASNFSLNEISHSPFTFLPHCIFGQPKHLLPRWSSLQPYHILFLLLYADDDDDEGAIGFPGFIQWFWSPPTRSWSNQPAIVAKLHWFSLFVEQPEKCKIVLFFWGYLIFLLEHSFLNVVPCSKHVLQLLKITNAK